MHTIDYIVSGVDMYIQPIQDYKTLQCADLRWLPDQEFYRGIHT